MEYHAKNRLTKGQQLRAAKAVTPPHVFMKGKMETRRKITVMAHGPIRLVTASLWIPSNMARLSTIKTLKDQGLNEEIHSQTAQSGATLVIVDHLLSLCKIAAPPTRIKCLIKHKQDPLSQLG